MALDDFESEADQLADEPRAANVEPLEPTASAGAEDDWDEDDDLFGFDELISTAAETASELDRELEELLAQDETTIQGEPEPLAAPDGVQEAPPPSGDAPETDPETVEAVDLIAPAPAPQVAVAAAPQVQTVAVSGGLPSRWAVVLVVVIVFFNLLFAAISWRTIGAMKSAVDDIGQHMIQTADTLREQSAQTVQQIATQRSPNIGSQPEGWEALARGEQELRQGEYALGRKHLYSLLCVIDRLDEQVRDEIEARALLLIGDSYRLQADPSTEEEG